MRWVLLLVLLIALGGQQQTVVLEGAVRDAVTGAVVQGVKVAVYYPSTMGTGFPTIGWPVVAQGNPFHYEVLKPEPNMAVQVWADGYRRQIEPIRGEATERHDFALTAASPASGRLVDDATGAPVADVNVMVGRAKNATGVEIDPAPNFAITDAQGRFHFDDVGTGPFVLRMLSPRVLIRPESATDNVSVSRKGYPSQWIPGDLAEALARAYNPTPKATLELGDVRVSRSDMFMLSGRLSADDCTSQLFDLVQQNGRYFGLVAQGSIPCGEQFTVASLAPGTYYLFSFSAGGPQPTKVTIQLRITNQDVRQDLRMVPAQTADAVLPDDFRRQMTTSGLGSW